MVDLSRLMQDAAILEVIDKSADEASNLSAQNSYQAMRIEELEQQLAERDALREELGRFQASRIQLNDDGSLDEIVGSPGHLEQLDTNHWFVCLGAFAVWLHAKGKITASYEDRAAIDAERAK